MPDALSPEPPQRQSSCMKIATWNLQSDKKLTQEREALFRQAMNSVDADVWVLTETWVCFLPLPGYRLVAQTCEAVDLEPARRWVAIWSKLDAKPVEVHGQPDRMACGRIEKPGQRDLVVIGTVLPWHFDRLWPNAAGFCAALAGQLAEWDRLLGTPRTCALSVAGDFNQSLPHQNHYGSKPGEAALNDAMRRHDLLCLTQGNDLLSGTPRIDHICVSQSGLQAHSAPSAGTWSVPLLDNKPITDHSGAYADFEVLP